MNQTAQSGSDKIGRAFAGSLCVIVTMLLIGGATYFFTRAPAVSIDEDVPVVGPEVRDVSEIEPPSLTFSDITQSAGIDFVHHNGAIGEKMLPETMGSGCAFFDYDNDGDPDLLILNGTSWPSTESEESTATTMVLYENDGTGNFHDITEEVGLNIPMYGSGCAVGDFDNDGDSDLFISCVGKDCLFRNDGGKFVDATSTAGVGGTESGWGTSCGWFDYDNDNDLDLFVCQYVEWNRDVDLQQEFSLTGDGRAYGRPQLFSGSFPILYRNNGDETFTDVSKEAGIQVENFDTKAPMAKSLGLGFCDFDEDGWIDIFVANDTVQNFLFHNQQDGTFVEQGILSGVAFDKSSGHARGAMGVDIARFREGESAQGIAIGNFANEMTALYVSDSKYMNFTDDAVSNGLGPNTRLQLTFGVLFLDADLDGRLDLFATNGHLNEEINEVQSSQHYEQAPQLFWNAGAEHATEFVPLDEENMNADFLKPLVGRGASTADIDGDGDLDLLITTTGQRPRLLKNEQATGHHWLRLSLTGAVCKDAIGSRVVVTCGEQTFERTVVPTRSYLSQVEKTLTFGLGEHESIDAIAIHWNDGTVQTLEGLEVNQYHRIQQPNTQIQTQSTKVEDE